MIEVKTYYRRPTPVRAALYDGTPEAAAAVCAWVGASGGRSEVLNQASSHQLIVRAHNGDQLVKPGHYVLQGREGEFYPCPPAVMSETYEEGAGV